MVEDFSLLYCIVLSVESAAAAASADETVLYARCINKLNRWSQTDQHIIFYGHLQLQFLFIKTSLCAWKHSRAMLIQRVRCIVRNIGAAALHAQFCIFPAR